MTVALTTFLSLVSVAAFAMGGAGYSGGGGYRGGMGSNGSAAARDEYDAALRLIEKQEYADAIPHLKHALMFMQGNADVLNYLGYTSRMTGDYPASLDYYQRALARDPDHKGAHEYLGELYLMMHQPDQARLQLAELVRLCPDGCVEKDTLTQALSAYATTNPSSPAPTGTPSAQPAPAAATPPTPSQQPNR
jgi:tetratricopeptide (TPR) repeat protein